jgi:hypothetical protein
MLIEQWVMKDFPAKDDYSVISKSVENLDECPEVKGRVRADVLE